MKKTMKVLCLVLALMLALPLITACNNEKNPNTNDTPTETGNTDIANIPQKNYNKDFVILNPNAELYVDYYWSEDLSESSNISNANYNRETAIEAHLGIEIYHEPFERVEGVLYSTLENAALAGDDDYQLVLTHTFQDLVSLMSQSYLLDLSEIPAISMDDEYYNNNIMNNVKYKGHKYLGSSDLILHAPAVILFNKPMADSFSDVGCDTLYQHVRDKTWTIDQMFTYAKLVNISLNDSLADPMEGTYGFISQLDWEMTPFVTASGYSHVTVDDDGNYALKSFNDNVFNIFQKIVGITDSDYFYGWGYSQQEKAISMDSGRALFGTVGAETMIKLMTNSSIKLGVLPYPTVEAGKMSQSLDWAGYFCVPATVKDQQLSGEVVELLSYYGETEIKHEYYDVLLGSRSADAPQDKEMLELIYDNLTAEPALAFLNKGASDLADIFYAIPRLINRNQKAMSSWYANNYGPAKIQIEELNK